MALISAATNGHGQGQSCRIFIFHGEGSALCLNCNRKTFIGFKQKVGII